MTKILANSVRFMPRSFVKTFSNLSHWPSTLSPSTTSTCSTSRQSQIVDSSSSMGGGTSLVWRQTRECRVPVLLME